MNESLKELYGILQQSRDFKGMFKDETELGSMLSSEQGINDFYSALNLSDEFKGTFKDATEFSDTFQLKKKVSATSKYLQALAGDQSQGQPSATKALGDFWQEQEQSSQVLPPLQSKQKVKKEEVFAQGNDISSVLDTRNKLPEYLKGEQDRIVAEVTKGIEDEISKLGDKYSAQAEANPEKAKELETQFKEEGYLTKGQEEKLEEIYREKVR